MFRIALHWQIFIGMVLGAVIGLTLNATVSVREVDVAEDDLPSGLSELSISDSTNVIEIRLQDGAGRTRVVVVDATHQQSGYTVLPDGTKILRDGTKILSNETKIAKDGTVLSADDEELSPEDAAAALGDIKILEDGTMLLPSGGKISSNGTIISPDGSRERFQNSFATLGDLKKADSTVYDHFQDEGRSTSRRVGDISHWIGGLFLQMLRMVAVPLIVTSLVTGVMGLGHAERLGKMFSRTLAYYICTSVLAIVTGLLMVNIIRPGLRGNEDKLAQGDAPGASGKLTEVLADQVQTMIPPNPIGALAEGNFLSIICFSIAFAIFALLVGGKTAETIREFFRACFEVMMAMTVAIIKLAPLGVLFLMLYVTATHGPDVFESLAYYMLAVACALGIHAVIVLPLILYFVARRNPLEYAKAMSPALLTAFSSASSNGTLPLTMTCVEQRAGVSNRVGSFVLPLGATVNMDGTALYEAVAVLFIAQLYHGANLPLSAQIIVAVTALLASIGAAGIPQAGLVMMVIILQAVGLPLEMQAIIIGVDRVLDMCRTSVNVWSDSCGCAVIARFEAGGD